MSYIVSALYINVLVSKYLKYLILFSRDSRLYKGVCPSIGPSVHPLVRLSIGPSVRNAFFLIGQKWVETNKNEISDDEAGRDYTSHDLFRVYELVFFKVYIKNIFKFIFYKFSL